MVDPSAAIQFLLRASHDDSLLVPLETRNLIRYGLIQFRPSIAKFKRRSVRLAQPYTHPTLVLSFSYPRPVAPWLGSIFNAQPSVTYRQDGVERRSDATRPL